MGSYRSDTENPVSNPKRSKKKKKDQLRRAQELEETESGWNGKAWEAAWPSRSRPGGVTLEVFVDAAEGSDQGSDGGGSVARTKSLTDDDLEELKGCLDLGFGFSYDEIPELCNTLPALELCYSMSRSSETGGGNAAGEPCSGGATGASPPIVNWKISSPGDHPEEVKARLKFWAQTVACTVRLCN